MKLLTSLTIQLQFLWAASSKETSHWNDPRVETLSPARMGMESPKQPKRGLNKSLAIVYHPQPRRTSTWATKWVPQLLLTWGWYTCCELSPCFHCSRRYKGELLDTFKSSWRPSFFSLGSNKSSVVSLTHSHYESIFMGLHQHRIMSVRNIMDSRSLKVLYTLMAIQFYIFLEGLSWSLGFFFC